MMILFLVERVHVACYLNPVEACFLLFRFSDALIVCCLHWSLGRRQLDTTCAGSIFGPESQ